MPRFTRLVRFWALLDIGLIFYIFVIWPMLNGQPAFFWVVESAKSLFNPIGSRVGLWVFVFYMALILSILVSSYLLLKRNDKGALLTYFQYPFRLPFIVVYYTLFCVPTFIYLERSHSVFFMGNKWIAYSLMFSIFLIDFGRLISVVLWHKCIRRMAA